MSEELKPCPFCGGTDVYLRQHLATNMSWVSCAECGLEAPSETGWTDDIAIEYWNTRSDTAKDAEIEKLKAIRIPSGFSIQEIKEMLSIVELEEQTVDGGGEFGPQESTDGWYTRFLREIIKNAEGE